MFKKVSILFMCLLLTIGITGCSGKEKLEWPEDGISKVIPKPDAKYGTVSMYDHALTATIEGVDKNDYKEYVKQCKKKGFTIDADEKTDEFESFNAKGYKLRVYTIDEDNYHISVDVPIDVKEFSLPNNGMVKLIPEPKSKIGKVEIDTSSQLMIYIGKTSIDDFNSYIDSCIEYGFNVEHSRSDKSYSAKNSAGYKIYLSYYGFEIFYISMYTPDEQDKTDNSDNNVSDTNTTDTQAQNAGDNTDFKAAMDSYEAFFNEYVDFMNKYSNSDDTTTMMSDYANYMAKYSDMMQKMNAIKKEELSVSDAAYYVEVMGRINQKLLTIQ